MLTVQSNIVTNGSVIQYYDSSSVYEENIDTKTVIIKKFIESQMSVITQTETNQIQTSPDTTYELFFQ